MLSTFETVTKALADSRRIRILKLLEGGELCVCDITGVLGLSAGTVSRHLAILREAGFLAQRRDGKWIHYRLAESIPGAVVARFLALLGVSLNDDAAIAQDRETLRRRVESGRAGLCPQPIRPEADRSPFSTPATTEP